MGRLIEIYEPWEKPGGLSQEGVAQVIEKIKERFLRAKGKQEERRPVVAQGNPVPPPV